MSSFFYAQGVNYFSIFFSTFVSGSGRLLVMKIKARVSKQGFMGSASREHKVKKGKGSFTRKLKHKKGQNVLDLN